MSKDIQQIKTAIQEQGRKLDRVAEAAGISRGHLSYCLNGHRTMSKDKINKIRAFLNL